ncbi:transposon Tf2-1 polyprotein isoform X1 [Cucumis melo var. makuwa]|uniref:Transposon Tf2-1 polyprotein isoform X1 n=1 Tax=Cucumis melo var. makuwa TaxID=1194695 RepID=A0A5A7VJK3_CUCMM|nr:transposon Tf2-1 polyprotein isoform X1 [Cucumis melo var. makuwa]TYK15112.1 transposon Tf2-1 polyprotein isoform X1 [Cucumis melo var. makuwa]
MTLPVLAMPDLNLPFEIETNVSGYGVRAVLTQAKRPIVYFSRTLSTRDRARPVYERELIAVVFAMQRWRPYLLERKLIVKTDQRLGLENKAADALSRVSPIVHLNQITAPALLDLAIIQEEVENDPRLKEIKSIVEQYLDDIPNFNSRAELYWDGIKKDIKKYREECSICQRNKALALSPAGLLTPLEILDTIWIDISMDFIDGLPKSAGYEVIFVVVDRMSKYAHFISLKHPYTAKSVAEVFVKEVVRLHGYSRSIVSSRDRVFVRHTICKLMANRVVNRGVEAYLRCILKKKMQCEAINQIFWALQDIGEVWASSIQAGVDEHSCHSPSFSCVLTEEGFRGHTQVQPIEPYLTETHEWMTQPEEVYGYRKNLKTMDWEVLISWKGLPPHEATWEVCDDFKQQFPDFHLEDKVDLEEESSVKPPMLFTYNRRNKRKLAREMKEGNAGLGELNGGPNS